MNNNTLKFNNNYIIKRTLKVVGPWRNGSACDFGSQGWGFESLRPCFLISFDSQK